MKEKKYSDNLDYSGSFYSFDVVGLCSFVIGIGLCEDKDIKIPPEYNETIVIEIGPQAFDSAEIDRITLPETIKMIDELAFQECSLKEINLNEGLLVISDGAFESCENLTSITIPDSVEKIADDAFFNCINLKEISVANSELLESVELPNYCKIVDRSKSEPKFDTALSYKLDENERYYTVTGINNLNSANVVIPDTYKGKPVEVISSYCFSDCNELERVSIGKNVETIGYLAFNDCKRVKQFSVNAENKSYKSVDGNLYDGNGETLVKYANGNENATFNIPDGVKEIGERAVRGNNTLQLIKLPDGLFMINKEAFAGCSALVCVVLPDSVSYINADAFTDCTNLKSVKLSNNLGCIGEEAFAYCKSLEKIDIPDSVLVIDNAAFYGCENLKSVSLSNSITRISNCMFCCCSSLEEITIPSGVTKIEAQAFANCFSLKSVTIPDTVKSIGWGAFYNCTSLTSITIPGSVTSIDFGAFENCNLKSIVIDNADLLKSAKLPKDCKVIDRSTQINENKLKLLINTAARKVISGEMNYINGIDGLAISLYEEADNLTNNSGTGTLDINKSTIQQAKDIIEQYTERLSYVPIEFYGWDKEDVRNAIIKNIDNPQIKNMVMSDNTETMKPSEVASKAADESITKVDMTAQDRGIKSLTNMNDRDLVNRGMRLKSGNAFETLYNGESLYHNEERDERALMSKICILTSDKAQALRVFRSSGQFRDYKPTAYYEKMLNEQMVTANKIKKEAVAKVIKTSQSRQQKSIGTAKA